MIPHTATAGGDRIAVGRAWPHRGSIALEGTDQNGRLRAGLLRGDEVTLLPFASDPKLPGLSATGELLVHRFGKRAVVREGEFYRKVVRPGRAQAIADGLRLAADYAERAGIVVPEVVEVTDDSVLLTALPGTSFFDLASAKAGDSASWDAAWNLWARLWPSLAAPGVVADVHTHRDEIAVCRRWVDAVLAHGLSPHPERLEAWFDDVARQLEAAPTAVPVLTHRDLHDKQLLFAPGQALGVIDFDTLVVADPALDIANLAEHLRWRCVQGLLSENGRDKALSIIDDLAASQGISDLSLSAYAAATRLRLHCVYLFRPQWRDVVLADVIFPCERTFS